MEQIEPPEESGRTFEENAILKFRYYSQFTDEWLFAEDSGLEVEALRGAPGVYSARFAGPQASDEENNERLLRELAGVQDRRARYVCVIALGRGGRLARIFEGEVEGEIAPAPQGEGGFGYDPLFYYPPLACTFAQLPMEVKDAVSHRGRAFRKMMAWLTAADRLEGGRGQGEGPRLL
jgi:XTP/dITP diphosphohydrolase